MLAPPPTDKESLQTKEDALELAMALHEFQQRWRIT